MAGYKNAGKRFSIKERGAMSTKDTVLALFEKNKGFFISGERIAEELNISRTAVWKAVKKLQSEGYEIKAVTNRGYCLDKESDVLTVRGISSHLNDNCKNLRPEVFVRVDSTNTRCIEKAEEGESEGYVAVAGTQSAGRGRRGKAFFSPAESGIYMSILLRPVGLTENQVLHFTTMAAAAVSEAIEDVSGKKAEIKWVNDVFIDGKKVCGILSEASYGINTAKLEYVIVGIGINAYEPAGGFPSSISDIAGCVFDEPSAGLKNRLAAEVLNRFMAYYEHLPETPYSDEYIKRSMVTGKDITVHKGKEMIRAHVLGIDEEFGLKVRYEDGSVEVLRSGEISIRI